MLEDGAVILLGESPDALRVRVRHTQRARRLQLRVHLGEAILILPKRRPTCQQINDFLEEQHVWLLKHVKTQQALLENSPVAWPVHFLTATQLPFFGRQVPVHHKPHRLARSTHICWQDAGICIEKGARISERHLKQHLERAYRAQALACAQQKAVQYSCQLGLAPSTITIRQQSGRWGSCSAKGTISINWLLLLAPETVFEYVVAHEMSHLRYASHGVRFWQTVKRIHPGYEHAEQWLKRYGLWLQPIRKEYDE